MILRAPTTARVITRIASLAVPSGWVWNAARARPHHHGEEQPGQQRLERVQQRLGLRDPHAGRAHPLRLRAVPRGEHVLAADPAQDAQPGHGVRAQGGQPAGGLALLRLAALQRPDQQRQHADHHGQPEQHQQAQRHGGAQQQHAEGQVRGDAADQPGQDREHLAHPQRVGGDRRHHLAGGQRLGDGVAGAGDVVADLLRGREGRAQPVLHLQPVTDQVHHDLHHADAEERQAAEPQRAVQAAVQAVVHHATERPGQQRRRDVPHHVDHGGAEQHAGLTPALPPDQGGGTGQRRRAGVGERERTHDRPRYG
jgi:hypothetical protein